MKERPILMTPENAQKCFDGSKTQTRRLVKGEVNDDWTLGFYHPLQVNHRGEDYPADRTFGLWGDGWDIPCPYGVVGDRLWIREAFTVANAGKPDQSVIYRGDPMFSGMDAFDWKWTPSIHLPRWACRMVVEITEIRVERVQEISDDDKIAEGMDTDTCLRGRHDQWVELWESINGEGSWERNDWVWCLSFRKI